MKKISQTSEHGLQGEQQVEIKPKRVVIYTRSAVDIPMEGNCCKNQEDWCRSMLERCSKDWNLVALISDPNQSGASLERPGFSFLLSCARKGLFDVVVVCNSDRLWRSSQIASMAIRVFKKQNISVFTTIGARMEDSGARDYFLEGSVGRQSKTRQENYGVAASSDAWTRSNQT